MDALRSQGSHTLRLPEAPASARVARRHVAELTGGVEDPRLALVITELVTNAVVHGRGRPLLRVERQGPALRVEVSDEGPGLPRVRPFDDQPATSGRGLAMVEMVADEWGVDEHGDAGKTVWALVTPG